MFSICLAFIFKGPTVIDIKTQTYDSLTITKKEDLTGEYIRGCENYYMVTKILNFFFLAKAFLIVVFAKQLNSYNLFLPLVSLFSLPVFSKSHNSKITFWITLV